MSASTIPPEGVETNRTLTDSSSNVSIDWDARILKDLLGVDSVNWNLRKASDTQGNYSINWADRELLDVEGTPAIRWSNAAREMYDHTGSLSVNYTDRQLVDVDGNIVLDWSSHLVWMRPNNTNTVTFDSNLRDQTIYNDSASVIGSLTINLPSASREGQILRYVSKGAATSVTVNGSVSVGAALTSLPANGSVAWQAIDDSLTFVRIQ